VPDTPTCQLLLKWELKGAQKGLESLPHTMEGELESEITALRRAEVGSRRAGRQGHPGGARQWAEEPVALRQQ
jgi:hypothetical protein